MIPELKIAVDKLRRRAHVHTDGCYGAYEPCGEHHVHDMKCGGRSLWCRLGNEPELVLLLAEVARLEALVEKQMPVHACSSGGCSKPAQVCKSCAKMLEDGAMHRAWDRGWVANEVSSGDLQEWARQRRERNPYPPPNLAHVCGHPQGGTCLACVARTDRLSPVARTDRPSPEVWTPPQPGDRVVVDLPTSSLHGHVGEFVRATYESDIVHEWTGLVRLGYKEISFGPCLYVLEKFNHG
jgi:hypothetical protein